LEAEVSGGTTERRLAAIMAADVVGFSRQMATDEAATLARIAVLRTAVLEPLLAEHRGRLFKTMGDGFLAEFGSAVQAVACALAVQARLAEQTDGVRLRIGVHQGDVVVQGEDLMGDGVNIAARLEPLAEAGGIVVSARVREDISGKLTVAVEDIGEQSLKNITRAIRAFRIGSAPGPRSASVVPEVQQRPSIAVMPFANLSGDPDQEHFCDGLVEDIITTLSKLTGLRVIARNSSHVYKGQPVAGREVAEKLGVRFVLEGSVRKNGNRIRITAQLIDARDGAHVWAERYDRVIDDIFAIQDEITLVLATEMQVKLTEGEHARLHYTTTTNIEAWTYWIQGLSHHRRAINKESQTQARTSWEKALVADPASASLNALLGMLHSLDARFGWWNQRETAMEKAQSYVDRALEIDPENANAYTTSSLIQLFQRHHDNAVVAARKAVELAPGAADTAELASHVLTASGFAEEAVRLSEKAITLNPNYPAVYLGTLGNAYRLSGRIEQAVADFQAYHARNPGFGLTDIVIAYQQTGRFEEARQIAQQLLATRPNFTIAAWLETQFSRRDTAQVDTDAAALKAAGLPLG